jgi:ribosome maturation factor RimP
VQNKLKNDISELAESVLNSTDFFLVDVDIKGTNPPEIWIYVDGEERGINMDECANLSNELSFLMDAHELYNGAYLLNVSSPGLSKPLVDRRQYPKNKGRKVKVKYKNNNQYNKLEGTLKDYTEQKIIIGQNEGELVELPFDQIVETKIIPSL